MFSFSDQFFKCLYLRPSFFYLRQISSNSPSQRGVLIALNPCNPRNPCQKTLSAIRLIRQILGSSKKNAAVYANFARDKTDYEHEHRSFHSLSTTWSARRKLDAALRWGNQEAKRVRSEEDQKRNYSTSQRVFQSRAQVPPHRP